MEKQEKRRVIIVGGGIAGLSAGIYALRSGFDAHILERHGTFGGFQTGWTRKGYFFEGGMHWLTGSSPRIPLNRVWRETGALRENNPVENRDPYYTLIDGGKRLSLYRDLKRLRQELLRFAPEDRRMINRLCRDISLFKAVHLPLRDVAGLKAGKPSRPGVPELLAMAPAALRYFPLVRTSYKDYVSRFKNKNLRHLLLSVIGHRYNAISFIYTMASFASGDSGYPSGGSVRLAGNMMDTFLSLGGKVSYRTKAERVVVEGGKAVGVRTEGGVLHGDAVIVASDTRVAIDTMLDRPVSGGWADKFRSGLATSQNMFIALGVRADFSHLPHSMVFPLDKPFEYAGCSFTELRVNNYSRYGGHSPEGGTALTCILLADCYGFWRKARDDGSYARKKQELGRLFVETLSAFLPEVGDRLDVVDVATPVTYERYCGSYNGSWMTVWKPGCPRPGIPQTLKGVKGLYFAGQRILMCGGLPMAVYTGRRAVQLLCRDTDTVFV